MRYDYRSELTAVFESDRICFVRVSELLIGDYLVMINDYENVNRFIGASQPGPFTEEKEISWVRKKLENNETVFSMIDKENGAFIGNIAGPRLRDGSGLRADRIRPEAAGAEADLPAGQAIQCQSAPRIRKVRLPGI